jgi:signal transduction histidine kinase
MATMRPTAPRQRLLLGAAVLVLVPGFILGYLGFRSLSDRAESLRRNYTATAGLVRDRLEAEVERLEADVVAAAETFVAVPRTAAAMSAWLEAQSAEHPWLADPFFLHRTGGVVTASVSSDWPQSAAGPPRPDTELARLVREGEAAEATGDLNVALDRYRQARAAATSAAGRCLALTRIGRVHFQAERFESSIASYRAILDLDGDTRASTGVPCAVIALSQIGEGFARLGDEPGRQQAQKALVARLVETPWDVQRGYGFYLARVLESDAADQALMARARALSQAASRADWIRFDIGPRLKPSSGPGNGASPEHAHLPAAQGEVPVQIGYRLFEPGTAAGEIVAFGYTIRADHVGGVVLPALLESIELGDGLTVGILDDRGRWRSETGIDGPGAETIDAGLVLADAGLQRTLPGWTVALLDRDGRSVGQIVGRENRVYGVLMAALVLVLAAGVVFTVRAASREVELSRLKSDFVANVTHELKTPLALIRMYGETLESGLVNDDARRREFVTIIRRESERLTHLINNVLDFGRIDSGGKAYTFMSDDIVSVVRDALDAYRYFLDRAGMAVEADLPAEAIRMRLDRDAIAQALVNLLHNAMKYGADGRYVRVRVRADGSDVLVEVTDRGAGIPEDELDRIFEKYHRVGGKMSSVQGSGLGLAIVKHTVEGHGGRVEVESTLGRGSTFTMRLPVEGAAGAPPATDSA